MSAPAAQKRMNGKIEFLRFLFSVIILIHHSRYVLGDENSPFLGDSLGVEFFFFVSGYLMMLSIERKNQSTPATNELGRETAGFLLKKWLPLLPQAILAWGLGFVVTITAKGYGLRESIGALIDGVWEMLLLSMSGIGARGVNGAVWYVSAMLLGMAILYPLLRKFPDIMLRLIIPVGSLLIFGFLYQNYGNPRDPTKWLGLTYKGNLRAIVELGLGAECYYLTRWLKSMPLRKAGRLLMTATEWSLYLVLIIYMDHKGANRLDYLFVVLMALAVCISFSEQGVDASLFQGKIFLALGRFSVPLYFAHRFWASHLNTFLPGDTDNSIKFVLYLAVSVVSAVFVLLGSKLLHRVRPHLSKHLKKLFLEP